MKCKVCVKEVSTDEKYTDWYYCDDCGGTFSSKPKDLSDKDISIKTYLTVSRIEGLIEGMTKGLVSRLEAIERELEALGKRVKK